MDLLNPDLLWETGMAHQTLGKVYDARHCEPDPEESEADIPVPDRLLPKAKQKSLWNSLKLSQQIGILMWINRREALSPGGKERLLYLQAKASFEAIEAGLRFAQRLDKEKKLQSDFGPHINEANRRPQSKRFRRFEASRIGVGYRDKGTLPDSSEKARRASTSESWLYLPDLPEEVGKFFQLSLPAAVEGDWLDLQSLTEYFSDQEQEVDLLLNLL